MKQVGGEWRVEDLNKGKAFQRKALACETTVQFQRGFLPLRGGVGRVWKDKAQGGGGHLR